MSSDHRDEVERHAGGLESESQWRSGEDVSNCSDRTDQIAPIPARMVSGRGRLAARTQDGARRLGTEKDQCSDVGRNADRRDGRASLWLCTDVNEPQYANVIEIF